MEDRIFMHNIKIKGQVIIPRGYSKLANSLNLFLADGENCCNNYDKNVFIMTRYITGHAVLESIDKTIRKVLKARGLFGHRADDKTYTKDRNLWDNLCIRAPF